MAETHVNRRLVRVMLLAVLLVAAIAAGVWFWHDTGARRNPIPTDIKSRLDFVVLYPAGIAEVAVDRGSFKYDAETDVLSFIAEAYGTRVTITEQATPDNFNDIPQYYDKVIERMYGYSGFDTDIGKVDLTRPSDLGGDQVAVMNAKGVLLFAHPEKDLTPSQWRKIFNNMEVVK